MRAYFLVMLIIRFQLGETERYKVSRVFADAAAYLTPPTSKEVGFRVTYSTFQRKGTKTRTIRSVETNHWEREYPRFLSQQSRRLVN